MDDGAHYHRTVVVFRARTRARCQELWAVLDAAGIDAAIDSRRGGWLLRVREADLERAVHELDDYRREVVGSRVPDPTPPLRSGGWIGILAYASVLVAVAGLADTRAFGSHWFDAGRSQAGLLVQQGEWWRSVTALTLHVDTRHLMGNLLFGSVLGFLAAQGLGAGAAWLAILAAGALGNVVNAILQQPSHSAVGASTAVFAALGLLVALALRQRRGQAGGPVRRWSPLVAGVLLLAWTGMGGERTDVMAHVWGLLAGLVVGMGCTHVPPGLLDRRSFQVAASLLALLLVVTAWALALR